MKKISIITTTYNQEKFISQTIESIINQTYPNWELLIWDDNWSDNSYNIALEYAKNDSRIKVRKHKENLWIVGNMNFLISQVSNDTQYIAFLEGDDIFTTDNLEKKLNIFNKNKELLFIYSNYENIDEYWRILNNSILNKLIYKPRLNIWINSINLNKLLLINWNPIKSFGCVIFDKSILNLFYPLSSPTWLKQFGPLDYFTWLKILPKIKFYYLEEKLLLYRNHSWNYSWLINSNKMLSQIESIYKYFLNDLNYLNEKKTLSFCQLYTKSLRKLLDWKKIEALKTLTQTYRFYPLKHSFNRLKLFLRIILPIEWITKR